MPGNLREDLIELAGEAAAKAKDAVGGDGDRSVKTYEWARAAKTALEAAGLTGPAITPDEITAALNGLTDELLEAGLFDESAKLPPAEFLAAVLRGVVGLRRDAARAEKTVDAYRSLETAIAEVHNEYLRALGERRGGPDDPAARQAARLLRAMHVAREAGGISDEEAERLRLVELPD